MNQKVIALYLTNTAWNIVDEYLMNNKIDSIQSYLNNRTRKILKERSSDFLICNCDKTRRNFFIPEDICHELIRISELSCIPLSKIVQRNFIDPILLEYSKEKGILL